MRLLARSGPTHPSARTPNYPAIIRWLDRNGAVIEEVVADKGQAIEMPQDAVDYEFEADCDRDMFRLVGPRIW